MRWGKWRGNEGWRKRKEDVKTDVGNRERTTEEDKTKLMPAQQRDKELGKQERWRREDGGSEKETERKGKQGRSEVVKVEG